MDYEPLLPWQAMRSFHARAVCCRLMCTAFQKYALLFSDTRMAWFFTAVALTIVQIGSISKQSQYNKSLVQPIMPVLFMCVCVCAYCLCAMATEQTCLNAAADLICFSAGFCTQTVRMSVVLPLSYFAILFVVAFQFLGDSRFVKLRFVHMYDVLTNLNQVLCDRSFRYSAMSILLSLLLQRVLILHCSKRAALPG